MYFSRVLSVARSQVEGILLIVSLKEPVWQKPCLNIDFSYYCNSRKELAKISHRATPNFKDGEEIKSNHVPQNRELTVYKGVYSCNSV